MTHKTASGRAGRSAKKHTHTRRVPGSEACLGMRLRRLFHWHERRAKDGCLRRHKPVSLGYWALRWLNDMWREVEMRERRRIVEDVRREM